jgi:hypothetical protein
MRNGMTSIIGVAVFLCWMTMAWDQPAIAAKGDKTSGGGVLKGEVLIVTDDFYLIKERGGKGVQVHLDKSTKRNGTIKVGDNVEAQVSTDGRAVSIKLSK